MVAARVEADTQIARHLLIELRQGFCHLTPERIREHARDRGQTKVLVTGRPAHGEVGGQVVIGIAETIRTDPPDLLAAQTFAQGLKNANFVIDTIDPRAAAGRILNHDVAPLWVDHTVDRDLIGRQVLTAIAFRSSDRR
jgi:hypothetical protein